MNHAISFQKKNETKSFSDDLVQCNEKYFEHTVRSFVPTDSDRSLRRPESLPFNCVTQMCLIQSLVWIKGVVQPGMKPIGSVSPAKYSSPALRIPLYPITACKRSTLLPRQGSQRARHRRCRSSPYRDGKRRRMRAFCCTGVRQVSCCISQFCVSVRTKLLHVNDKRRLSLPPVRRERPPPPTGTYDSHAAQSGDCSSFVGRGLFDGGNRPRRLANFIFPVCNVIAS